MSELEDVEREYRQLQTRLIYRAFEDDEIDPAEEQRLRDLAERRVALSAPNLAEAF